MLQYQSLCTKLTKYKVKRIYLLQCQNLWQRVCTIQLNQKKNFFFKFVTKLISIDFPITKSMHTAKGRFFNLKRCSLCDWFNWFEKLIKYLKKIGALKPNIYTSTCSKLLANKNFYLFSYVSDYMGKLKL